MRGAHHALFRLEGASSIHQGIWVLDCEVRCKLGCNCPRGRDEKDEKYDVLLLCIEFHEASCVSSVLHWMESKGIRWGSRDQHGFARLCEVHGSHVCAFKRQALERKGRDMRRLWRISFKFYSFHSCFALLYINYIIPRWSLNIT